MNGGFLEFVLDEAASAGRKTQVWLVLSVRSGETLGVIRWFGPWRQYTFAPAPSTVFNPGCLREIADKAGYLTNKHRERAKVLA